jgi:hypothetical protein
MATRNGRALENIHCGSVAAVADQGNRRETMLDSPTARSRESLTPAERDEHDEVTKVLSAFVGDGEYMATLVARFLDEWHQAMGRKKPLPLPAEFLLELSAVIRIAIWQRAGLTLEMGADFPPWQELLEQLLSRLFTNPTSFSCDPYSCPAPLRKKVVEFWFQRCSWTATLILGTDIVIHPVDEELLLDALADALWQHRNLVNRGGSTHGGPQEE